MTAIGSRPLLPLLLGVPLFVGVPFGAILLAITVVGIPLAVSVVAAYGFWLYASRVVAAAVVGQAILGPVAGFWPRLARLGLGLGILVVVGQIPVAGMVVGLLTMFFGLGTFVLWLWRSRSSAPPAPATATGPPAPPAASVPSTA